MVRRLHHLHVVFHHHQGVSQVPQAVQRIQQLGGIAFVEAHRGFVQNVEHSFKAATDLACKADTLGLATAQGVACTVEPDVAKTHTDEELQTADDFTEQGLRYRLLAFAVLFALEIHMGEPVQGL